MPAAEGAYGDMLGPSVFNGVNHQFLQKWCYILLVSSSGHGSYCSSLVTLLARDIVEKNFQSHFWRQSL